MVEHLELISVIMSVYNEPLEWLKLAIESILNQTYSELEFIIVLDNPENIVSANYLDRLSFYNNKIVLIKNEHNIGLVNSLNKGLKVAKGKYIARMDADDISYKNRIEIQMDYLKKNGLDLCGSNYECFNDNMVLYSSRLCSAHRGIEANLRYGSGGMAHPTWFGTKEIFNELLGYRNIEACEDLDFIVRGSLSGFIFGNTKEVLLKYRDNNNSISHKKEEKQLSTAYLIGKEYKRKSSLDIGEYNNLIETNQLILGKVPLQIFKIQKKIMIRIFYEFEKFKLYI